MSDTTTTCRCGRPTRDAAYVCDDCLGRLNQSLGDVTWLSAELDTTISRSKGVDYTSRGGARDSETPMPYHPSAAEAGRDLKAILVSWVRFCQEEQVRNSAPCTCDERAGG